MAILNGRIQFSGKVLPPALQKKYQLETSQTPSLPVINDANDVLRTVSRRFINTDRTFTSQEIEEQLQKTSQALISIQKQIQRGEETYYDEAPTNNIFKGWDSNFIDSRIDTAYAIGNNSGISSLNSGINNSNSNNGSFTVQGGRRLPADFRWFSASCTSAIKHVQHNKYNNAISTRITPEFLTKQTNDQNKTVDKNIIAPDNTKDNPQPIATNNTVNRKRALEDALENNPQKQVKKEDQNNVITQKKATITKDTNIATNITGTKGSSMQPSQSLTSAELPKLTENKNDLTTKRGKRKRK